MDHMSAMLMGQMNRGKELKVFDWEKAAHLIKEKNPETVSAGLAGDWEYTGGKIWADGKPIPADETYVYLASTWATPEICIDGDTQDCYRMQSTTPRWASDTYWPPEALAILEDKS